MVILFWRSRIFDFTKVLLRLVFSYDWLKQPEILNCLHLTFYDIFSICRLKDEILTVIAIEKKQSVPYQEIASWQSQCHTYAGRYPTTVI